MEQAIKIAIENGWVPTQKGYSPEHAYLESCVDEYAYITVTGGDEVDELELSFSIICLDPLFWQALGKGLEWEKIDNPEKYHLVGGWKYQWHQFIDYLAEGKEIESFFNELIK